MNSKLVLLIFLITLFLSACGAECKTNADCPPQCKGMDDCQDKKCFMWKCQDKKCVIRKTIDNCCGNEMEETTEDGLPGNECTCPEDYGVCAGTVGEYLQSFCSEQNQCVTDINPEKVDVVTLSDDLNYQGLEIKLLSSFNQVFNMDKDSFKARLELKVLPANTDSVKISKLELSGVNDQRQTLTLAEKAVNKVLWTPGFAIEEELFLDFPTTKQEEELGSLMMRVSIEYSQGSGSKAVVKTAVIEKRYKLTNFVYANPDTPRMCPDSCDDQNDATADMCSPDTEYFCAHTPIPGRCGNYVCEAAEDRCTCEVDCGPCQGDIGDYIEYVCSERKCQSKLKDSITLQPITKLDDKGLTFGRILAKYKYDTPFSYSRSLFEVEVELKQLKEDYPRFEITTIRVLDRDEVLAEKDDIDEVFDQVGDSMTISMPASFHMSPSEQRTRTATLKVWYSFEQEKVVGGDVVVETQLGQYANSLGRIDFINPELSK